MNQQLLNLISISHSILSASLHPSTIPPSVSYLHKSPLPSHSECPCIYHLPSPSFPFIFVYSQPQTQEGNLFAHGRLWRSELGSPQPASLYRPPPSLTLALSLSLSLSLPPLSPSFPHSSLSHTPLSHSSLSPTLSPPSLINCWRCHTLYSPEEHTVDELSVKVAPTLHCCMYASNDQNSTESEHSTPQWILI